MSDYDTHTARGMFADGLTAYDPDGSEAEIDLYVYCTVRVQVTLAKPFTDDELAAIAAHEIGWNAEFISVDRVEKDVHYQPPTPAETPTRPAHGLFRRFRSV